VGVNLSAKIVTATREAALDLSANIVQHCFQQLYKRWQAYIVLHIFEGGFEDVHLVIWCNKTSP
jgi:hypothetical protein